jgi:hypothetical protein
MGREARGYLGALFRMQVVRVKREAKDASRDSTVCCVLGLMTEALEGMPAGPPVVGSVVDLTNLALSSQVRDPEGRLIATLPIVLSTEDGTATVTVASTALRPHGTLRADIMGVAAGLAGISETCGIRVEQAVTR